MYAKKELPRNKEGKKMYPVCSWEQNQHKLYNAHDRISVAIREGKATYKDLEKLEEVMFIFESHVIGGMVYATWEDRNKILNYTWAYDARH